MKNFEVGKFSDGKLAVGVDYMGNKEAFTPVQILAMLFSKLKGDVESYLGTSGRRIRIGKKIVIVLTVPSYFTSSERQCMLNAAKIAGLDCFLLPNETTATALTYGHRKQQEWEQTGSRNVCFIDFGHSSIQAFVVNYGNGELKIIATTSAIIGGRDFDNALANHFSDEFFRETGEDPKKDKKEFLKLLNKCEELKIMMSTNSSKLIMRLDNFMGRKNFEWKVSREYMEEICVDILKGAEEVIKDCLIRSKILIDDIHSIEIVGGSTRIPKIKQIIEEIFKKNPGASLNQNESVAHGGVIYYSMSSRLCKGIVVSENNSNPLQLDFYTNTEQLIYTIFIQRDWPLKHVQSFILKIDCIPTEVAIHVPEREANFQIYSCVYIIFKFCYILPLFFISSFFFSLKNGCQLNGPTYLKNIQR